MKLSDQEQVVLRAIAHVGRGGLAEIAKVIRAVGYPKETTKKVLIELSNKGAVSLHRHDYPASIPASERKLMVRHKGNHYGAVSVRERNPGKKSKGKTALKTTGRALKGFARSALSAGSQILGAGAMALNPHGMSEKAWKAEENKYRKSIAAYCAKGWTFQQIKDRLWLTYGLTLSKLESNHAVFVDPFRRDGGFTLDLNAPKRGRKTNPHGKHLPGLPAKAQREYEDILKEAKKSGRYGKRKKEVVARTVEKQYGANPRKRKAKRNAARTVSAAKTTKRRSVVAGKNRKAKAKAPRVRSVAKTRKASTRRASNNPTRKGMRKLYREAKRISKTTRGRYFSSESGQRKAARHEKRHARKSRHNPSAESIRKTFAGSVNGERDLFFPQGTPSGKLAKLGKLVSITTEEGTIKPVHGSAWLCADTKGKLHIGSTSGAPLFDGPARSFGHVTKLEYESSKPHLGYKGPIIWFHRAGEENGVRPTLRADGKGGLVFKGGAYRLTRRGIEN